MAQAQASPPAAMPQVSGGVHYCSYTTTAAVYTGVTECRPATVVALDPATGAATVSIVVGCRVKTKTGIPFSAHAPGNPAPDGTWHHPHPVPPN